MIFLDTENFLFAICPVLEQLLPLIYCFPILYYY